MSKQLKFSQIPAIYKTYNVKHEQIGFIIL